MKRSFYEMLGVARDADQAQIHVAYGLAMERLNAEDVRGIATAVNEGQLIREGYQILSDPIERARYDAKLAASDAGFKITLFPEDSVSRRKLGIETVMFAVVSAILGAVVHAMLTQKTDEPLVESRQEIATQKGEPSPPITMNATRPDMPDAAGPETSNSPRSDIQADAPRSDSEDARAGAQEKNP
jgi:curved DNA-binding protein CbpA